MFFSLGRMKMVWNTHLTPLTREGIEFSLRKVCASADDKLLAFTLHGMALMGASTEHLLMESQSLVMAAVVRLCPEMDKYSLANIVKS